LVVLGAQWLKIPLLSCRKRLLKNIEVFSDALADAMKGLRAFDMQGINLTRPHKVEVLKYLREVS